MNEIPLTEALDVVRDLAVRFDDIGHIYPPSGPCSDIIMLSKFLCERERILRGQLDKKMTDLLIDEKRRILTIEEAYFIRERLWFANTFLSAIEDNPSDEIRFNFTAPDAHYLIHWLTTHLWMTESDGELYTSADCVFADFKNMPGDYRPSWSVQCYEPSNEWIDPATLSNTPPMTDLIWDTSAAFMQ